MSRAYDFLRECGVFYVLTNHDSAPQGRPFGAVMELDGTLYISTANTKAVYAQLKANPQMQIVALRPGTREWLRLDARAEECHALEAKREMMKACPVLQKRYPSAECEYFALFALREVHAVLYTDQGAQEL